MGPDDGQDTWFKKTPKELNRVEMAERHTKGRGKSGDQRDGLQNRGMDRQLGGKPKKTL